MVRSTKGLRMNSVRAPAAGTDTTARTAPSQRRVTRQARTSAAVINVTGAVVPRRVSGTSRDPGSQAWSRASTALSSRPGWVWPAYRTPRKATTARQMASSTTAGLRHAAGSSGLSARVCPCARSMCSWYVRQDGGCLVAELDPADLAGGSRGVSIGEDDATRAGEGGQACPAELDQVLLGYGILAWLPDDERYGFLQAIRVQACHHDGLRHRLVLEQPALDLGGRDPDAAGLQHVAGAAEAGVVAVGVLYVGVAGTQPLALEHSAGRVVPGPVAGRGRVAADEQGARGAPLHRGPVLTEDLQLVTGDRDASSARADLAFAVGQEDVQQLGHADAVQDVDAETSGPAFVERLRQGFAGRCGQADVSLDGVRVEVGAEHAGEEGGAGEEQGYPVLLHPLGHQVRAGRLRLQHGGGAHGEREQDRVPQAVGEERL